jgi:hypothetical protein
MNRKIDKILTSKPTIEGARVKSASLAVPTLDHYLPMIYIMALQEKMNP